jgi:beta-xylosidase
MLAVWGKMAAVYHQYLATNDKTQNMISRLASLVLAGFTFGAAFCLAAADDSVLLFTSFRKNGQDGLHLMWSRDGYTWTALKNDASFLEPKVGGKLMRDPNIIQGPDGTFHMVWTTGWTSNGLGYASSKDLLDWSPQQLVEVMTHEPKTRNVWAPELFYLAARQEFLIFWSSTIPGRFPETATNGDKGYNHRIYATTTKDFKTYSPTTLFYNDGFNVIDATIVQDGSRFVMLLKDETLNPPQKNLRLAVSDKPEGPYGKAAPAFTGKYWAEGPTVIKIGDTWFVYFDRYREHRYGVATTKDFKTWNDESDKVSFPKDHRHGTVFRVSRAVFEKLPQ